jgi:hypothetical protein
MEKEQPVATVSMDRGDSAPYKCLNLLTTILQGGIINDFKKVYFDYILKQQFHILILTRQTAIHLDVESKRSQCVDRSVSNNHMSLTLFNMLIKDVTVD